MRAELINVNSHSIHSENILEEDFKPLGGKEPPTAEVEPERSVQEKVEQKQINTWHIFEKANEALDIIDSLEFEIKHTYEDNLEFQVNKILDFVDDLRQMLKDIKKEITGSVYERE